MRSHGVTGFPDPSGQGGIHLDGTGVNPFSAAFKVAQAACRKLLRGGGPSSRQATEQQKKQLVAISECIRSTASLTSRIRPRSHQPAPGLLRHRGHRSNLFVLVPSTINPSSPAFEQAANVCTG
jgi:hypothetical protein